MVPSNSTYTYEGYTFNIDLTSFVSLAADNSFYPEPFNYIKGPNIQFVVAITIGNYTSSASQTPAYFGVPLVTY